MDKYKLSSQDSREYAVLCPRFKYQVDKSAPLPTGESIEKINEEAYPEDYHGPKESDDDKSVYPRKDKQQK